MKRTLPPLLLLALLAGLPCLEGDDRPVQKPEAKPAAKLPLGKDTTVVTGPLDKEGFIDYEAALNAELSRGITAETNANALLIQAFGPEPEKSHLPLSYFKWLDIPPPPRGGVYMIDLSLLARDRLALTDNQVQAVSEQQTWACTHSWKPKDYPIIAEWLKLNEKMLAVVREAAKRPEYFNPLASRRKEGEPSNIIAVLLPTVQLCRAVAALLTANAMLRIGEEKFDAAWQDILACHRLGRLTSRGGTVIEGLVGIAICGVAHNATVTYLAEAKLTSKQALERLQELRSLPPLGPYSQKVHLGERFMTLDALQLVRRSGLKMLDALDDGPPADGPASAKERRALDAVDWAPGMRAINAYYDRMAAAVAIPDRVARDKAFEAKKKEDAEFYKGTRSTEEIARMLLAEKPDPAVGLAITTRLLATLAPAAQRIQNAYDRFEQLERNLHVALALAAYHADQGRYPAKLVDLTPRYLPRIPGDLFSGKELIYKPSEKGYLVYSVGVNGKDEGGRWYDDEPPGDDPRVKMPLPPLKKN